MTGELAGKIVVVTGASKGMGRAFTAALVAHGAKVAAVARESAALDALSDLHGDAVLPIAADMADGAAVRAAIDRAAAHFGQINVLVNNAAITTLLKLEIASDAEIQREYAVNLHGPAYASSAAIPHLRAAGGGDLVFISSESVRMPYPYLTLYASTKGGVESMAAGLRSELREQGTRVTVLRSGTVATGGNLSEEWPADRRDDFFVTASRMGNLQFSGAPATPETMACTLLAVLSLPRDVNVDLVEARGRGPASL